MFPGMKVLQRSGLLLKERICSIKSKFFPLKVYPYLEKRGKMKTTVACLECVPSLHHCTHSTVNIFSLEFAVFFVPI